MHNFGYAMKTLGDFKMWLYAIGSLLAGLTLGAIAIEADRLLRDMRLRRKEQNEVFEGPWGERLDSEA